MNRMLSASIIVNLALGFPDSQREAFAEGSQ